MTRKVSFRVPENQFKKIEELIVIGEYKDFTDFFRGAVEILLLEENQISFEEMDHAIARKFKVALSNKPMKAHKVMENILHESQKNIDDFKKKIAEFEESINDIGEVHCKIMKMFEDMFIFNQEFIDESAEKIMGLAVFTKDKDKEIAKKLTSIAMIMMSSTPVNQIKDIDFSRQLFEQFVDLENKKKKKED